MAKLHIHTYPDSILRFPSQEISGVDDQTRQLVDDMLETMVASDGIGLAAPQVGRSLAIFVVDVWWPETKNLDQAKVFINPKIIKKVGSSRQAEGCLSLPGLKEYVDRASTITITAMDRDWKPFTLVAEGLLSTAIQHEFDHLNGMTILDRLGPLTKRMAVRKLLDR